LTANRVQLATIITGTKLRVAIVVATLISSLKVIDITALNFVVEEAPHPYRWVYAFFILAVTTPIVLMSVAASQFIESKSGDYHLIPENEKKK
jgi:hypothetical protein